MIDPHDAVTRADLTASGMSARAIREAVHLGEIVRARRNEYVSRDVPTAVMQAVRVGGRLTCLSLLELLGVFVFANATLHVHLLPQRSRLRSSRSRMVGMRPREYRPEHLHWMSLVRPDDGTRACVGVVDALVHSVLCQPARHAIASLDSALNKGLIGMIDVADIFAALPEKYAVLRPLIDARAQSGPETLMRLMVRAIGADVVPQVRFRGIGRVDFVVDGWLVIECDSRQFHSEWSQQVSDRARDLALAALGHPVLRVTAQDIMHRPDTVIAAVQGLLHAHG